MQIRYWSSLEDQSAVLIDITISKHMAADDIKTTRFRSYKAIGFITKYDEKIICSQSTLASFFVESGCESIFWVKILNTAVGQDMLVAIVDQASCPWGG